MDRRYMTLSKSRNWVKAVEYCNMGNTEINESKSRDGFLIIKGKVLCDFGFVHHPIVALLPDNEQVVISTACDCYESNEGANICSHCASIFYKKNGNMMARIIKDPRIRLEVLTDSRQDFELSVESDKKNDYGLREVTGKAYCNFGFVHKPVLVLDGFDIMSSYCDCYMYTDSVDMCPHCKTLYSLLIKDTDDSNEEDQDVKEKDITEEDIEGKDIKEKNSEEDFTKEKNAEEEGIEKIDVPKHAPETMQIVFGTSQDSNKPVVWCPNDTRQVFFANTGILGTMGTGKTQFTKSLIAQMAAQAEHNFTGCPLGILIFDYKGDYNENDKEFVKATNAKVLKPRNLPYNPFSLDCKSRIPQLPVHTAEAFVDILSRTKEFRLGIKQRETLTGCIMDAYAKKGITNDAYTYGYEPPTFNDVYDIYLNKEDISRNDTLAAVMNKLNRNELFEREAKNAGSLYDMVEGVVVIDISGYEPSLQNLVVAITLEAFYAEMINSGDSKREGHYREIRKMICVDEAENIMSGGYPALKKIMKEARSFGVGVILSTQLLKHFSETDDDYSGYILTWVVHNVPDLRKKDLEYLFNIVRLDEDPDKFMSEIKKLECFHSIVKIGNHDFEAIRDKTFFEYNSERGDISAGGEEAADRVIKKPSINELSYSFCNARSDLYPDETDPEIPYDRFSLIFGDNKQAKLLHKRYHRWKGSCSGMTSSSAMFYCSGNDLTIRDYNKNAERTWDLELDDINIALDISLRDFIEAMQIVHLGPEFSFDIDKLLKKPVEVELKEICDAVKAFEEGESFPVIISVYENQKLDGGHAVFPFHYEVVDQGRARIHLYDPNFPGEVRYCELWNPYEESFKDWEFYNTSENIRYSSDNGAVIQYRSFELFLKAWQNKDKREEKSLFSTNSKSLEIKDKEGKGVVIIDDGIIKFRRDDVSSIIFDGGNEDSCYNDIWLSPGIYHIINNDSEKAMDFDYAGENGAIEVTTESKEVIVEVDDEHDVQRLTVVEANSVFCLTIISSTSNILIRGITSKTGAVISCVEGRLEVENLGVEDITELKINNVDTAIHEYMKAEDYIEEETDRITKDNEDSDVAVNLNINGVIDDE